MNVQYRFWVVDGWMSIFCGKKCHKGGGLRGSPFQWLQVDASGTRRAQYLETLQKIHLEDMS